MRTVAYPGSRGWVRGRAARATLAFAIGCAFGSLGWASVVFADEPVECAGPTGDWVLVTIQSSQVRSMQTKLLQHLRAELAAHRILVCGANAHGARPPMAAVKIERAGSQQVGIEVRVDDAVTHKAVMRELDLTGLPADAHAMTVALGVSELLRASWAEVNLRSHRETSNPVPASVRQVLAEETPPERAPAAIGVRLAGEVYSGRLRQAGVDAALNLEPLGRWQLGVRLGTRQGLNTDAPHGRIRAHGWQAGLVTGLRLTPREAVAHLVALARLDAARVQFLTEAQPDVSAGSGAGTGVTAGFGILGAMRVSPKIDLSLEADAGSVIKGVRVRDAGEQVVGMTGAWMGVSAGVSVSLW